MTGSEELPEVLHGTILPPSTEAPSANYEFHVSELASETAGAMSPFGDDVEFPLPLENLGYVHPGPADRPFLAGDA